MTLAAVLHFAKGMIKPAAALAVVAMAVGLSYLQKLSLEREMVYSVFRAFLQLSVIGFVLQFIFSRQSVAWIFLAYIFMVCNLSLLLSPLYVFLLFIKFRSFFFQFRKRSVGFVLVSGC